MQTIFVVVDRADFPRVLKWFGVYYSIKAGGSSKGTMFGDGAAQDHLPVSQFPTVSYLDLVHHSLIPDPYVDQNEVQTLWFNYAD